MNRSPRAREEADPDDAPTEADADLARRGYRAIARAAKVSVAATALASPRDGERKTSPWRALSTVEIDDDGLTLVGRQRWSNQASYLLVAIPILIVWGALPSLLGLARHDLPWWWTFVTVPLAWSGQIPLRITKRVDWRALRRLDVDRAQGRVRLVYAVPSRWPAWMQRVREHDVAVVVALDPHAIETVDAHVTPHLAAWARVDHPIAEFVPGPERWLRRGAGVAVLFVAIVCGVGFALMR